MSEVIYKIENGTLIFLLKGLIDSSNAPEVEKTIREILQNHPSESIVVDLDQLEYTTSAGLRIILRLKQDIDETKIINAHPEIYNILEMTGFTDLMDVEKAYRVFSVEGCEVIGRASGDTQREGAGKDSFRARCAHCDSI